MVACKTFELPTDKIPAALYGAEGERVWLYIHGKCGCKEEAEPFAELVCPRGWQVLSIDLPEHGGRKGSEKGFVPWDAVPELEGLLAFAQARWSQIALRATSLGAWFSLLAFGGKPLARALLVSPVLDMGRLIGDMMTWAGVSRERLETEGEIPTHFGETLSWRYLQYVEERPVASWDIPTAILYGGRDNLVRRETAADFARRFSCELTVLEECEHWFHTPEQLAALRCWEKEHI